MNRQTVSISCVVDGELRLTNPDAQALLGTPNKGTWANIRGAIGLPEKITEPNSVTFTEADIRWAWVCQKWIDCKRRRGKIQTTYKTFKILRETNTIDQFLGLLECLEKPANVTEINSLIESKKQCLTPISKTSKTQQHPRRTSRKTDLFPLVSSKKPERTMKVIQLVPQ